MACYPACSISKAALYEPLAVLEDTSSDEDCVSCYRAAACACSAATSDDDADGHDEARDDARRYADREDDDDGDDEHGCSLWCASG